MKHKGSFLVVFILVSGFLFSCDLPTIPVSISEVEGEGEMQQSLPTHTATNVPEVTAAATSTSTEQPSPTPEPTEEPTPTLTSTPTPTPQPKFGSLGGAPITASSLGQLELLDTLGNGRITQLDYHQDAGVFILETSLGIYLYAGESLERLAFFEGCSDAYSVPGKAQIIAVTPKQTMILIDLNTVQVIQTMAPEGIHGIGQIAFSQNGKVMGLAVVQDHEVRLDWEQYAIEVWNLEQNRPIAKLVSDLFGICTSMAFTEDNTRIIADCYTAGFSRYKKLVLWDISQQEMVWYLSNAGMITKYPFSRDGSLFATFTDYRPDVSKVYVRRTNDGAEVARLSGRLSENAFSHDSQHIVTSSIYTQVKVWNTKFSYVVTQFATGVDWPSVSYSKDGSHILVNGGEQAWDASEFVLDQDYKPVAPPVPTVTMSQWRQQGHLDGIRGVEVLDDGQLLVWGFSDNEFIWWWSPDTNMYDEVSVGTGKGQPTLSPDRDQFAICTEEGLKLVDLDQKQIEVFNPCRSPTSYLAFSEDGERLYLNTGTIIDVISLESGEILQQLRVHSANVGKVQTLRNGDYLISSSAGKISGGCEIIFWELNPLNFVRRWIIPVVDRCLEQAAINQNGSTLVTVDEKVSIWRVSDGWYLKYFDGTAAAFSNDDSLLAAGTRDSAINFYETDRWALIETIDSVTGQEPGEDFYYFMGGSSGVKNLRFANQGQLLISTLYDDVIQLWGVP